MIANRFVGVDVSLTATAMIALDINGKVVNSIRGLGYELSENATAWEHTERAKLIASGVVPFCKGNPNAAIESYAFGAKGSRAYQIGELGGIIKYQLADKHHKPSYIPPSAVKKFATGKGNAKKVDVIIGVMKRWGYEPEDNDDNLADAFVLAQMMRYAKAHRCDHDTNMIANEFMEKCQKIVDSTTKSQYNTLKSCGLV